MTAVGSDNGAYLGSGVNSNGERVIRMYYQGKPLDQFTPEELSNAHGAPVQDAKSKYLDDLSNIPGLEVKSRTGQQQTMGETTKQTLNDLDYIKMCECNQMQAKLAAQTFAQQQIYQKQAQAAADYISHPNPLLFTLEKKDQSPMDKTEVAVMVEKAKAESMKYTDEHVWEITKVHLDHYHAPEFVPPKAPRSRAPWYISAFYMLAGLGTFVHVQHYSTIPDRNIKNAVSVISIPLWPMYWAANGLYWTAQGALSLDTWANNAINPTPKAPAKSCTDDKSGSWAPDADGVCHMPQVDGSGGGASSSFVLAPCSATSITLPCASSPGTVIVNTGADSK